MRATRTLPTAPVRRALVVLAMASAAATACARPAASPPSTAGASVAAEMSGPEAFKQRCEMCHAETGQGFPGTHPPLVASDLVTARNAEVPIRIVLLGMQGERTINGTVYRSPMPRYGTGLDMTDAEVAAVLTYVRRSWGNDAPAIETAEVTRVREALAPAGEAVTMAQLRPLLR